MAIKANNWITTDKISHKDWLEKPEKLAKHWSNHQKLSEISIEHYAGNILLILTLKTYKNLWQSLSADKSLREDFMYVCFKL